MFVTLFSSDLCFGVGQSKRFQCVCNTDDFLTGLFACECEGCTPCECDVGGADGVDCNQLSGQCTCVRGTTGRHCDQYVY